MPLLRRIPALLLSVERDFIEEPLENDGWVRARGGSENEGEDENEGKGEDENEGKGEDEGKGEGEGGGEGKGEGANSPGSSPASCWPGGSTPN